MMEELMGETNTVFDIGQNIGLLSYTITNKQPSYSNN